jgi:tetratricopeptide (TPR) repeat protein
MPYISACLIVRDEAANLPRCLGSLRRSVDEIVVVDTGSTDATIELARAAGTRVSEMPWQDDFSLARNESLRQASGEWLMWIDADEELFEARPGSLRRLCRQADARGRQNGDQPVGYFLEVRNLDAGDKVERTDQLPRVFPNRLGGHFEGAMHEQLLVDVDWRAQSSVWVCHRGYASLEVAASKFERNRQLLERQIEREPRNPVNRYDLGRLLLYAPEPQFEPALRHLEAAIELWRGAGSPAVAYLPGMFGMAAWAAIAAGRPERTLELAAEAPPAGRGSDFLHFAGIASWRLGRFDEAVACVQAGIDIAGSSVLMLPEAASARGLVALAELACDRNQAEEAYALAFEARQRAPEDLEALFVLALAATKGGRDDDGLSWARQAASAGQGHWQAQARRIIFDLGQRKGDRALQIEALSGDVAGISPEEAVRLLGSLLGSVLGQ